MSSVFSFRDGVAYCVRDYQIQFGVQCDACQKFITGKVLEVRQLYCFSVSPGCMINITLAFFAKH